MPFAKPMRDWEEKKQQTLLYRQNTCFCIHIAQWGKWGVRRGSQLPKQTFQRKKKRPSLLERCLLPWSSFISSSLDMMCPIEYFSTKRQDISPLSAYITWFKGYCLLFASQHILCASSLGFLSLPQYTTIELHQPSPAPAHSLRSSSDSVLLKLCWQVNCKMTLY